MTTSDYRKRPVHRGVTAGTQIGLRLNKDQYRRAQRLARLHHGGLAGLLRDLLERACEESERQAARP